MVYYNKFHKPQTPQPSNNDDFTLIGNPKFVPIVKWYEFMQDLEFRLIDAISMNQIDLTIVVYSYWYSKLKPYITQYMSKEDIGLLSTDNLYELQSQLKNAQTDSTMIHNNRIYTELKKTIMMKLNRIHELVAQAKLELPIDKLMDYGTSITQMD